MNPSSTISSPAASPISSDALLADAILYAGRGISCVAVAKKRPIIHWTKFTRRLPSESELRDQFSFANVTGLAVIAGAVSGGLAVRDWDNADGYAAWASDNPALARTLPTVRTARGHHVYFRSDLARIVPLADGEYRGAGITIAPRSIHPSGQPYHWIIPLGAELPFIAHKEFVKKGDPTQNHVTQNGECNTEHSCVSCLDSDVLRLIVRCVPDRPGLRWHCLFRLARGLRGLPDFAEVSADALEPILTAWHRLALPSIATKDIAESRRDLWEGYRRVRFPGGIAGPLASALDPAYGHMPLVERIEQLCAELQNRACDAPFFLACRALSEVFRVDHVRAWRILRGLETEGKLILVERGQRRRASTYRFVGEGGSE